MSSFRRLHGPVSPPLSPKVREKPHTNRVHGLAVMTDGERLISSSEDGSLLVLSLASLETLRALEGHGEPVNALCFAGGARLCTGSDDETIRVWDTASWKPLRVLKGHKGWVRSVAWGDGVLVSASADGTVRFWDIEKGRGLRVGRQHRNPLVTAAVSRDGRRAASVAQDNMPLVWDVASGRPQGNLPREAASDWSLQAHTGAPRRLVFLDDGRTLLSVEREVVLWDLESGHERARWPRQGWAYDAAALHPEGRLLALTGRGIQLWDLEEGRRLATFGISSHRHTAVAFTPDGRSLVTGDKRGELCVWEVAAALAQAETETLDHDGSVDRIVTGGRHAVTGDANGGVAIWDLEEGRCVGDLPVLREPNGLPMALSPSGGRLCTANLDSFEVWDSASGTHQRRIDYRPTERSTGPQSFGFVDDDHVVAGYVFGSLALCDLQEQGQHRRIPADASFHQVVVRRDGRFAAGWGYLAEDSHVQAWDPQTLALLWSENGEKTEAGRCVHFQFCGFTPEGRLVTVGGTGEDRVDLRDPASGEILASAHFRGTDLAGVRLLPGDVLVGSVLDENGTETLVRLDLAAGRIIESRPLEAPLRFLSLAPDGVRTLAAKDELVVLMDWRSGEELSSYHAGAAVSTGAFSEDGARVVVGDRAGRVHLLAVESGVDLRLERP